MVVVLSSHAVSTGHNYHHIDRISVFYLLLQKVSVRNYVKNTLMHYVGRTYSLKMM
jgi:hypothetical protein